MKEHLILGYTSGYSWDIPLNVVQHLSLCVMVNDKARNKRIVELFFENKSVSLTRIAYESENRENKEKISPFQIRRIILKWEETGNVVEDRERSGRPRSGRCVKNISKVLQKVENSPMCSARRISRETGICNSTVRNIVKDEKLKPYKVQLRQTLTPDNKSQR